MRKVKNTKTTGSSGKVNAEFLKSRETVVESTPEKQYDKALKQYNQALRVNYSKYNQMAIRTFEDYLKHYPQGKDRNNALFYLERLYLRELDYKNHEKYLLQFRQEVPTSNHFYKMSDIDQAALYIRQNKTLDAQQILDVLLVDKANESLKREIYHLQLSIYKPDKDNEKIIAIYEYLINDPKNRV
jgi:TolA-binding protein